jgi:transcriptional antiterminator RfaH
MGYTPSIVYATCPWYVVYCQPSKEQQTAVALRDRLAVGVYLPEVKQRLHGKLSLRPLFPRYLFVQADLHCVAPSQINATQGVCALVTFSQQPQPISAPLIHAIRQRVDHINEQDGLPDHQFRPGDTVTITRGPLQGLDAVFEGPMKPHERVRVLIDFLGELRKAEVPIDTLQSATAQSGFKQPRRTRGKGRAVLAKATRDEAGV